jgi:hypothetical protein
LESFQKALAIRERLSAEAPSDFVALYRVGIVHHRASRRRVLVAHCHLSAAFLLMGQASEALDHARQSLAIATHGSSASFLPWWAWGTRSSIAFTSGSKNGLLRFEAGRMLPAV